MLHAIHPKNIENVCLPVNKCLLNMKYTNQFLELLKSLLRMLLVLMYYWIVIRSIGMTENREKEEKK